MELFKELLDYAEYLNQNPFHQNLGVNLEKYGDLEKRIIRETYLSVDPENEIPFSIEMDDLIRLHYLVTSRKVTTILEIGSGKSTIMFDHALEQNKLKYGDFVNKNLRRSNPFECHSVDNNEKWIEVTRSTNIPTKNVTYHYCPCYVTTFNDRISTLFDNLPNICPDLIYLDGPDQFSPIGDVRGISTNHPDRLPMSADILTFEHFLLPGTLIVVDGRTANARFLKTNLQRNWVYHHSEEWEQHFFELKEAPLGIYNKRQIEFCLGPDWEKNLKKI
jgi:hypothetical protein